MQFDIVCPEILFFVYSAKKEEQKVINPKYNDDKKEKPS